MRRTRSYRYTYAERPGNCPMCGSRTVSDLDPVEAQALAVEDEQGARLAPRWHCETCEALFFPAAGAQAGAADEGGAS